MSITVGDILRVVAVASWIDGNLNMNVFNAVISGTGGPFIDAEIVSDALTWVVAMYGNLTTACNENLDGSQVQVYVYDAVDDDWDEVGTVAWTWTPIASDDQLPRGVAGLINAKTLDPDVSGRKFIGGIGEANATDGLWTAGIISLMDDFADDWVTAFVGGTSGASWVPAVWSPTGTNAHALSGTTLIGTVPAYQRRRKRGVGV